MRSILLAVLALFLTAQIMSAQASTIQGVLQQHRALIEKSSRKSIEPAIAALAASGLDQAQDVLQKWQSKVMWQRKSDGRFFYGLEVEDKQVRLFDFDDGAEIATSPKGDLKQIKPNSGVRAMIGAALVQFQLSDPDPVRRLAALQAIERDPVASQLAPLRASIANEPDTEIKVQKEHLNQLLTIGYDSDEATRVAAIEASSGTISPA